LVTGGDDEPILAPGIAEATAQGEPLAAAPGAAAADVQVLEPLNLRWTEAEDSRPAELVIAGKSMDEAANDLDRPISTVWRRAKLLGLRWSRSRRPWVG
jgi:hypothetical protein